MPSLFLGFFTWLSFLILGIRARRRDWILTGAAYGVYSSLIFFALGRPEVDRDDTANLLLGAALVVAWFGGALHTGITYHRFTRLPRDDAGPRAVAAPAAPAVDDLGLGLGDPASEYLAARSPPGGTGGVPPATAAGAARSATPTIGGTPVDAPVEAPVEANTATQRTLTRLPGVTPALARRWVAERRRRGGFRDIDDLATALDLQPHEIVRLRPRLTFTAPGDGRPKRRLPGRGRVLDV
ncbi:MAG: helix-hairpin-helix domain-containing protein [Actinobacteria bacterium]|nr:helix-hairpin-helix domain-containing protein [Actinomycetota bacterium]